MLQAQSDEAMKTSGEAAGGFTKPSTTQASSTFLTERHFKLLPLEDVGGNVGSGRAGGSAN